jgi:uncharacterized membrane protein
LRGSKSLYFGPLRNSELHEARQARGTWISSHYRWQIRMFWFTLLWALIGWALVIMIIGAMVGVPILIALTLWLIYRIGRGWLRLRDRQPMYAP